VTVEEVEPTDEVETSTVRATIRGILDWLVVIVIAVAVALLLRAFVLQAFWIESGSMETTLEVRDRVMISRLSYRVGDPGAGDIIVFDRPEGLGGETRDLIKRVIAVEGETVEGRDGAVFVNGIELVEPYLDPGITTSYFAPTLVPDDHVWVMGDNRNRSSDSRVFGPIPVDDIAGKTFFRFWPLDRLGTP
jgi:signal peptidase I